MKVKALIEELKKMDQESYVMHLWDGALRTSIEMVYMGKTGKCVTADFDHLAYEDEARPHEAPSANDDRHWETPGRVIKAGDIVADYDGDGPHLVVELDGKLHLKRAFDHKIRTPGASEDWSDLEVTTDLPTDEHIGYQELFDIYFSGNPK